MCLKVDLGLFYLGLVEKSSAILFKLFFLLLSFSCTPIIHMLMYLMLLTFLWSSVHYFFILLSLFIILHSSQFYFPYSFMNPHMDNISLRNTCIQLFLNASLGNSLWTCSCHRNGVIGFTLAFFTIYMGTGWIFLLDHELRGWKQMDRKNVMTWLNFACRLRKSFHRYFSLHEVLWEEVLLKFCEEASSCQKYVFYIWKY